MNIDLPEGLYPFIDQRFPLSELAMIEVPHDLEQLLRSQATANGISIIRGRAGGASLPIGAVSGCYFSCLLAT